MELKWDSESRNRRRFFLCAALSSCHLRSDLQYSAPDTFSLARSLQVLYSKSHPRNTDIPLFGHLTWSEMQLDIKKKKKKKSSTKAIEYDAASRIYWISGTMGESFLSCFVFFCSPLGIGAGAWGVSVEETEFANFSQHENTKQNLRYSIAVMVCALPVTGWTVRLQDRDQEQGVLSLM